MRIIEQLRRLNITHHPHLIDFSIIVGGIAIVLLTENKAVGAFLIGGGAVCLISS